MRRRMKLLGACMMIIGMMASLQAVGQRGIRHVKGIKAIDGFYGITGHGKFLGASYVNYLSDNMYWKLGGYTENGEQSGLEYQSFGLDLSIAYTLKEFNETVFINVNAGATGVSDGAKANNYFKAVNEIKFGGFIGPEVEIFITDNFVLMLNWNQRYLLGSGVFQNTRWLGSAGIRFNF